MKSVTFQLVLIRNPLWWIINSMYLPIQEISNKYKITDLIAEFVYIYSTLHFMCVIVPQQPVYWRNFGSQIWISRLIPKLHWRHNERDGTLNHRRVDCLHNRLFRRRSKKTSKLRVTGFYEGNPPVTSEFPAQRASNAENVSTWWRHHAHHGSLRLFDDPSTDLYSPRGRGIKERSQVAGAVTGYNVAVTDSTYNQLVLILPGNGDIHRCQNICNGDIYRNSSKVFLSCNHHMRTLVPEAGIYGDG